MNSISYILPLVSWTRKMKRNTNQNNHAIFSLKNVHLRSRSANKDNGKKKINRIKNHEKYLCWLIMLYFILMTIIGSVLTIFFKTQFDSNHNATLLSIDAAIAGSILLVFVIGVAVLVFFIFIYPYKADISAISENLNNNDSNTTSNVFSQQIESNIMSSSKLEQTQKEKDKRLTIPIDNLSMHEQLLDQKSKEKEHQIRLKPNSNSMPTRLEKAFYNEGREHICEFLDKTPIILMNKKQFKQFFIQLIKLGSNIKYRPKFLQFQKLIQSSIQIRQLETKRAEERSQKAYLNEKRNNQLYKKLIEMLFSSFFGTLAIALTFFTTTNGGIQANISGREIAIACAFTGASFISATVLYFKEVRPLRK